MVYDYFTLIEKKIALSLLGHACDTTQQRGQILYNLHGILLKLDVETSHFRISSSKNYRLEYSQSFSYVVDAVLTDVGHDYAM